jgi:outer membrane protein assembly factor BamB
MKTLILLTLVTLGSRAHSADWPIFRGPQHNGISTETNWDPTKIENTTPAWEAEVGTGFASFVVANNKLITTGHSDNQDHIFCFDATTGHPLWKHSYPAALGDKYYEGGTGATPTIHNSHVYHISRWGDAFCLDLSTGSIKWQRQLVKDHNYRIPDWGFSGAPYIHQTLLILNVGQSGHALHLSDGTDAWNSANESAAGYSTPYPLPGTDLLLISSEDAYHAIQPATGTIAWRLDWKTRYGVNAADPIALPNGNLFFSSGYNRGCALITPPTGSADSPTIIWENKNLRNQFSSSILINDHLYGIDDDESKKASLRCLSAATGQLLWEERSIGFGALTATSDGKLIIQTEKGEIAIITASPEGYQEIARAQILTGRCWTTPVLANSRLYARNSAGRTLCLDLTP